MAEAPGIIDRVENWLYDKFLKEKVESLSSSFKSAAAPQTSPGMTRQVQMQGAEGAAGSDVQEPQQDKADTGLFGGWGKLLLIGGLIIGAIKLMSGIFGGSDDKQEKASAKAAEEPHASVSGVAWAGFKGWASAFGEAIVTGKGLSKAFRNAAMVGSATALDNALTHGQGGGALTGLAAETALQLAGDDAGFMKRAGLVLAATLGASKLSEYLGSKPAAAAAGVASMAMGR